MNLDFIDMLDGFKAENDLLLQNMEDALMQIQEEGMNDENINAVFRAAHTIKGSSGMFGIDYIVEFTHSAENLLDKIRNHKITIDESMIDLLLECKDQMQTLVDFVVRNPEGEPDSELQLASQTLIEALRGFLEEQKPSENNNETIFALPKSNSYLIDIQFGADTFRHGFDPYTFVNYLKEHAQIEALKIDTDTIPLFDKLDPTLCKIAYQILAVSELSFKKIEEIFDFVKDNSIIEIKLLSGESDETSDDIANEKIENISVPSISDNAQASRSEKKEQTLAALPTKQSNFIRIEADKVDSLINLVGEMVISNAAVMQRAIDLQNSELVEAVSTVSRMLEEIRENSMQIRMVPIGEIFNKFKRIVHDTANKVGKKVELRISGAETELDKTVVEKIADPLVHLIRNAIDHGIEAPALRKDTGKNEVGILELKAYHDTGSVVIEIIDDGKGLDAELLLKKGVEKGLVSDPASLTEKEIFELILLPGFSTAEKVSDISGRGVGMDVVKRNITDLRGKINIESQKSKGTRITVRLPLTLAIIDGFLTRVGNTPIIIPLEMVIECIELSKNVKTQMGDNSYINLRGHVLPLLNIGQYFNINQAGMGRSNIIVVQHANQKMGVLVDELHGEFQTVIKPIGKLFRALKSFSGSTILGNGEVALVMDIPIMIEIMETKHKEHAA
jgi:two-component system chemotaxis sensor kinase CheA